MNLNFAFNRWLIIPLHREYSLTTVPIRTYSVFANTVYTSPVEGDKVVESQTDAEGTTVVQKASDSQLHPGPEKFSVNSENNLLFECFAQNTTQYLPGILPRIVRQDFAVIVNLRPNYIAIRHALFEYVLRWFRTADFRDKRSLGQCIDNVAMIRSFNDHDLAIETASRLTIAIMSVLSDRLSDTNRSLAWEDYRRNLPFRDLAVPKFVERILTYIELLRYNYRLPMTRGRVAIKYDFTFNAETEKKYRDPMDIEAACEYMTRVMGIISPAYSAVNLFTLEINLNGPKIGFLNASVKSEFNKSELSTGYYLEEKVQKDSSTSEADQMLQQLNIGSEEARFYVSQRSNTDDLMFAYCLGISVEIHSSLKQRLRPRDEVMYETRDVDWIFATWLSQALHETSLVSHDVGVSFRQGGLLMPAEGVSTSTGPKAEVADRKRDYEYNEFRVGKNKQGNAKFKKGFKPPRKTRPAIKRK